MKAVLAYVTLYAPLAYCLLVTGVVAVAGIITTRRK